MDIIAAARAHFARRKCISIPEWPDADGKPAVIWWGALTAEEQGRINRIVQAKNEGPAEFTVRLIIEKATDETGAKLFTLEQMPTLLSGVDFTIINRISGAMLNVMSPEQALGN